MAAETDYDAPRVRADADPADGYLDTLTVRRRDDPSSGNVDVDDGDPSTAADSADPDRFFGDESSLPVIAQQADEFTCSRCFLVSHRHRLADTVRGKPVCVDCS